MTVTKTTMPKTARQPAVRSASGNLPADGRRRVIIENIAPIVNAGQYPIKRVTGETVAVQADVFTDGHDRVAAVLRYRHEDDEHWHERRMKPLVNDRWSGSFAIDRLGTAYYSIVAWVDHFRSWQHDVRVKFEAGQDVSVPLLVGVELIEDAVACAERRNVQTTQRPNVQKTDSTRREPTADDRQPLSDIDRLRAWAKRLRSDEDQADLVEIALDPELRALMAEYDPRHHAVELSEPLRVTVDRPRARFSTWYELFPRSAAPDNDRHGTFRDVIEWLPDIAEMGFDVLYLPPIHPIGKTHRKGPNNKPDAGPNDVGSPWAIGAEEGGHKAVHPELGTLDDFDDLVEAARTHGIEIALDIAFQCSPDHPYLKDHPEWFRRRPDGSIQYAENPPKKYQDIYPFDFETEAWETMWRELRSIFAFWIDRGVRIFRVDNPHTKAFPFWEWVINDLKREHPDVIFLAEAFTRPKVMYRLAKLGYTQSYTYFAWRNFPWEIREYFEELTSPPAVDFFRPNAWPNTPDILTEYLQHGGRPAEMARLVLAATLCASYGIYGPPFETVDVAPREPGSEEYLNSEKYQLRSWEFDHPQSLRPFLSRVNRIRRENPALHQDRTLRFHNVDNPALIAYSKTSEDAANTIICVVNTNPHGVESGTVSLDLEALGLESDQLFQVHDLLTDARYMWHGPHNFVMLDPQSVPAHVLRIRRRVRSEEDFEYYF